MSRRKIVVVGAVVSAMAISAGVAFAIPDESGAIQGCYQKNNGQLRVVNGAADCRPSELPLSWSQTGRPGNGRRRPSRPHRFDRFTSPQGPSGPTGPEGPTGATGATPVPQGKRGQQAPQGHKEHGTDEYPLALPARPGHKAPLVLMQRSRLTRSRVC